MGRQETLSGSFITAAELKSSAMGVVEVNQQLATRWADHYENRPEYCIKKVDWKSEVPREEGKIRIVCISDTHSGVEKGEISFNIPNGDILIHAGDFTNYGEVDKVKEFNTWLGTLPHTHKIVIAESGLLIRHLNGRSRLQTLGENSASRCEACQVNAHQLHLPGRYLCHHWGDQILWNPLDKLPQ